jgi:serine/threonine protein kinase
VESQYVVKLKKAIKTDARYYMFMEYCNGGDLKDLMEIKRWSLSCEIIQTIMKQLVQGFNDMISVLVIHRDLKLQNIMLHFPDDVDTLMNMNQEERHRFI